MPSATFSFDSGSDGRIYDRTQTAITATGTKKTITGFSVEWGGSYVGNYSDSSTNGCHIYFQVNGTTVATITYTTDSRPAIVVFGLNVVVLPNTAVTVSTVRDYNSYIGGADNRRSWIHIRGHLTITIYYSEVLPPTVSRGMQVTTTQMANLYYYKYGSSASPTQYATIYPWIFGSRGVPLNASDYNNAAWS